MMGFTLFLLNKGGVPAGGRLLVTKRRYMRLLGLGCGGGRVSPCGVWGRGGVTMRLLGVETSIKTTKNTTRTDSIITLQHQNPSKHECNLTNKQTNKQTKIKETKIKETNKQRSKKQVAKKETNKHTNNQQKNKHTNRQRTNRHNTSSTNNKSNLANTQQQEEQQQQEDHLGPTCFRRACADDPIA